MLHPTFTFMGMVSLCVIQLPPLSEVLLFFYLNHYESVLSQTVVDKVMAELESCGFQCLIAGIGGKGVKVCFNISS